MVSYKSLPAYGKIIYITVAVYLLTQVWNLVTLLFCLSGISWHGWFALPANLNDFMLKPWTLLTYMFCHSDLSMDPFHILFNMLWLWWFGQFFMQHHTARQMVAFYLCSGVAAGLFFLLCYNVFPYFVLERYISNVVGASGAIFALIVAVAMRQPEQTLGLNLFVKVVWIKMKWLAAIVLAINLLCYSAGNDGGTVCHIGGAIFGLIYGLMERRGTDITRWAINAWEAVAKWVKNLGRPQLKATTGGRRNPVGAERNRDMAYNAERRSQEEQIDAILEKISRKGYDALSEAEKQILFDASRRKRK